MRVVIIWLLFPLFILSACARPGDAAPVVKLGVIAPFEGRGRALGYAVLPAIKSMVADANASGELRDFRVAVMALDDSLDASTAARQAKALALDPEVLVVIGPFTENASASVKPILAASAVPNLPVLSTAPTDEDHTEEVNAAKEAANTALQALAADIADNGRPSRSGLSAKLVSP